MFGWVLVCHSKKQTKTSLVKFTRSSFFFKITKLCDRITSPSTSFQPIKTTWHYGVTLSIAWLKRFLNKGAQCLLADHSLSVNDRSSLTTSATLLLCFLRSRSFSLRSQNPISIRHSRQVPGDRPGGQVTGCTSGASCGGKGGSTISSKKLPIAYMASNSWLHYTTTRTVSK